jgi:hypothetical protein
MAQGFFCGRRRRQWSVTLRSQALLAYHLQHDDANQNGSNLLEWHNCSDCGDDDLLLLYCTCAGRFKTTTARPPPTTLLVVAT